MKKFLLSAAVMLNISSTDASVLKFDDNSIKELYNASKFAETCINAVELAYCDYDGKIFYVDSDEEGFSGLFDFFKKPKYDL